MAQAEVNLELDNTTGKNHEGKNANTPVKVLTASSVTGDAVENLQGDKLGTIKDVMLNLQDGSIEYMIVSAGGFLGIGDKLFAVPFHELKLNPERKSFTMKREKEYIKNAPGFDQNHWPETNNRFEEVDSYWGSTTNPVTSVDVANDTVNDRYDYNTRVTGSGVVDPTDQGTFRERGAL